MLYGKLANLTYTPRREYRIRKFLELARSLLFVCHMPSLSYEQVSKVG
jgi:hypothetical protein